VTVLFATLIFPGFLFVFLLGMAGEYIDRKIYARFQNRVGPPWFQPIADFIKLLSKEEIIPDCATLPIFKIAPVVALTASVAAFLYTPLWSSHSLFSFNGDIIVIIYLLTIPTLAFFVGAWYSISLYPRVGALRSITQLFAYEIPLFIVLLSPSILANTWSLSQQIAFYNRHTGYLLFNIMGFGLSLVALIGKLEKVPFDIPEAKTEIVSGGFTEYGGGLLAIIRLATNIEMIAGCSLLAAVFLPFGLNYPPVISFMLFLLKVFSLVVLCALFHALFARIRIDQMIGLCWKYMVPLSILQTLISLVMKGVVKS